MAKKGVAKKDTSEKSADFRRNVIKKGAAKLGAIASDRLGRLTDGQWRTLEQRCRFVARDAIPVLAMIGLDGLQETAE